MRPVAAPLVMRVHSYIRGAATVRIYPYPALLISKEILNNFIAICKSKPVICFSKEVIMLRRKFRQECSHLATGFFY